MNIHSSHKRISHSQILAVEHGESKPQQWRREKIRRYIFKAILWKVYFLFQIIIITLFSEYDWTFWGEKNKAQN